MALLVPSINVATAEAFQQRAERIRAFGATRVHVDVSDGIIGVPRNYADPTAARAALGDVALDVHLMVRDVGPAVTAWTRVHPVRVAIHLEAVPDPRQAFASIQTGSSEAGLALGPRTPLEAALPYVVSCDFVLLVAVRPGPSGQTFDPATVERVRQLRGAVPALAIGVDGGIKAEHIPALKEAGASVIYVASAIFDAPDPAHAYRELQRLTHSRNA